MFKKMFIQGTVMVASMIAAQAVIEKFEKASLNRDIPKKKDSKEKVEDERHYEDYEDYEDIIKASYKDGIIK